MNTNHREALAAPFAGEPLAEVLDSLTAAAVAAAEALTEADFAEGDPAAGIVAGHQVRTASVLWDEPDTVVQATVDQTMRARCSWPVDGDPRALTWAPSRRLLTEPSTTLGLAPGAVVAVFEDRHVTAQEVIAGQGLVRRYVTAHLDAIDDEIARWQPRMARRVRFATAARRRLLDEVAALEGSAALEAVAS